MQDLSRFNVLLYRRINKGLQKVHKLLYNYCALIEAIMISQLWIQNILKKSVRYNVLEMLIISRYCILGFFFYLSNYTSLGCFLNVLKHCIQHMVVEILRGEVDNNFPKWCSLVSLWMMASIGSWRGYIATPLS